MKVFGNTGDPPCKGTIEMPPFVGNLEIGPFGDMGMPPCKGIIDSPGVI